eukprot:Rhum_TRINITY_DN18576_c0_g1::Rhum_TRINITY_DN18576_c0_g1_i1::g.167672::m.167672
MYFSPGSYFRICSASKCVFGLPTSSDTAARIFATSGVSVWIHMPLLVRTLSSPSDELPGCTTFDRRSDGFASARTVAHSSSVSTLSAATTRGRSACHFRHVTVGNPTSDPLSSLLRSQMVSSGGRCGSFASSSTCRGQRRHVSGQFFFMNRPSHGLSGSEQSSLLHAFVSASSPGQQFDQFGQLGNLFVHSRSVTPSFTSLSTPRCTKSTFSSILPSAPSLFALPVSAPAFFSPPSAPSPSTAPPRFCRSVSIRRCWRCCSARISRMSCSISWRPITSTALRCHAPMYASGINATNTTAARISTMVLVDRATAILPQGPTLAAMKYRYCSF